MFSGSGGVVTYPPSPNNEVPLNPTIQPPLVPVTNVDKTLVPLPPSYKEGCRADDQVRCFDQSTYICSDQVCDGTPDCPGGDDESAEKCAQGIYYCMYLPSVLSLIPA